MPNTNPALTLTLIPTLTLALTRLEAEAAELRLSSLARQARSVVITRIATLPTHYSTYSPYLPYLLWQLEASEVQLESVEQQLDRAELRLAGVR